MFSRLQSSVNIEIIQRQQSPCTLKLAFLTATSIEEDRAQVSFDILLAFSVSTKGGITPLWPCLITVRFLFRRDRGTAGKRTSNRGVAAVTSGAAVTPSVTPRSVALRRIRPRHRNRSKFHGCSFGGLSLLLSGSPGARRLPPWVT